MICMDGISQNWRFPSISQRYEGLYDSADSDPRIQELGCKDVVCGGFRDAGSYGHGCRDWL